MPEIAAQNRFRNAVIGFFLPRFSRGYVIRLCVIAVTAFVFFKWICIPMRIRGHSMDPTYRDGGVNFCWRPAAWFTSPQRGAIVMVRYTGDRVMLLKRIVALAGETIEFRNGILLVNSSPLDEPYLVHPCDWNLEPVEVKHGYVYVIGDNRNVPISAHQFGQTRVQRLAGVPLW